MTKKLIMAFFALTVASIGAFAANDNKNCRPGCNNTDCCTDSFKCQQRVCDRKARPCHTPFEDLNLTDAQKEKIKALKESCPRANQKAENAKERRRGECPDKSEFLAKVKEILTPEQYVTFLENNFTNARHGKNKGHHRGNGKNGKNFNCPNNARANCPKDQCQKN